MRLPAPADRIQRAGLIAGLVAAAIGAAGFFLSGPDRFFQSYLVAYLFWIGLTLGAMSILMLHLLASGAWGYLIQPALEAGSKTMWLMAVLFLPLIAGLPFLYPWARPEVVAADPVLQHKAPYLNVPFFLIRAVLYFLVWLLLTRVLTRWAHSPKYTLDPVYRRRRQRISALAIIVYVLTVTFASIDWIMSLEPHWVSTIFGFLIVSAQALGGLALGIALLPALVQVEPVARLTNPQRFRDLGALFLSLVVFWAYVAWSQYAIIWSGTIPREVTWYLSRSSGGWTWVFIAVLAVQFILPFAVLLSLRAKENLRIISRLSLAILAIRWADIWWTVAPSFHPQGISFHWLDLVLPIAIGGIWIALFFWSLERTPPPVLPVEALSHGVVGHTREQRIP
jgi:hypothetical protein